MSLALLDIAEGVICSVVMSVGQFSLQLRFQAELLSTGNDGLRNQLEFDARQFVALLQILDLHELEQRIRHLFDNVGQPGPTSCVCKEDP